MTNSKHSKIGLWAFMNLGGISVQSRRLAKMIKPSKVLVVDSSGFSPNKEQHPEFFKDYNHVVTKGFPKNFQILEFIKGLDYVFTIENPYNFYLVHACQKAGIKVICQTNYEFCENLNTPHLPIPDLFLMPSHWKLEDMFLAYPEKVQYLPPPIDPDEFKEVREINMARCGKRRFLHIVGTLAWKDRNGTLDLIHCLRDTVSDFELVIKSQHELPPEYLTNDDRVKYVIGNELENSELYRDFDALILPRRYGGLSLTTNEALMAGMPVIMPWISPNRELLPQEWLVHVEKIGSFTARAEIDYYSVIREELAHKIDELCVFNLQAMKEQAFKIGVDNFSVDVLKPKYDKLWI